MKMRMYAVVNQENGKVYEDKLYKSQHRANVVKHIRNMTSRDHYHTEWIEVDISEPLYQDMMNGKKRRRIQKNHLSHYHFQK